MRSGRRHAQSEEDVDGVAARDVPHRGIGLEVPCMPRANKSTYYCTTYAMCFVCCLLHTLFGGFEDLVSRLLRGLHKGQAPISPLENPSNVCIRQILSASTMYRTHTAYTTHPTCTTYPTSLCRYSVPRDCAVYRDITRHYLLCTAHCYCALYCRHHTC